MSRRKIRVNRRQSKRNRKDDVYMSNFFATKDKDTGEISVHDAAWKVEKRFIRYMPLYTRAHELMPPPRSELTDPEEYRNEQAPAIETLANALEDSSESSDELLRAIAILGHSPNPDAIRALARFCESHHSLAPVASLALSECASLYEVFCAPRHASAGSLPC